MELAADVLAVFDRFKGEGNTVQEGDVVMEKPIVASQNVLVGMQERRCWPDSCWRPCLHARCLGHSYGAAFTVWVAYHRPEMVAKVVNISGGCATDLEPTKIKVRRVVRMGVRARLSFGNNHRCQRSCSIWHSLFW